jgi:hypothetical protein
MPISDVLLSVLACPQCKKELTYDRDADKLICRVRTPLLDRRRCSEHDGGSRAVRPRGDPPVPRRSHRRGPHGCRGFALGRAGPEAPVPVVESVTPTGYRVRWRSASPR